MNTETPSLWNVFNKQSALLIPWTALALVVPMAVFMFFFREKFNIAGAIWLSSVLSLIGILFAFIQSLVSYSLYRKGKKLLHAGADFFDLKDAPGCIQSSLLLAPFIAFWWYRHPPKWYRDMEALYQKRMVEHIVRDAASKDFVTCRLDVRTTIGRLKKFTEDTQPIINLIIIARRQYAERMTYWRSRKDALEGESRILQGILSRVERSPFAEGKAQERELLLRFISRTDAGLETVRSSIDELERRWKDIETLLPA